MKQTLLPEVADPNLRLPEFTFAGTADLIPHLERPDLKGLLATLMHRANVRCPLTVVAQQPVKGTAHSKGLQLHHYRGDGLQLRWHAPDASNDRNIQFVVRTPTAVIATAEQFHDRVSKAFEELYARQCKPRHKSETEKGDTNDELKDTDTESRERLADDDIELLFVALHDASHILKSGLIARKRIRNAFVHTFGYSNDQANTYIAQMLDAGDLANSDEMDFYGVGEKWKKYIPETTQEKPVMGAAPGTEGGVTETAVPAREPRSRTTSELITAGAARLFEMKPPAPPPAPESRLVAAAPAVARPAAEPPKKIDARVRLAQLMRAADEAARKRKRLSEIDQELTDVTRIFETYQHRIDELNKEKAQVTTELDSPKLKEAEARLKVIQEQLGD